MGLHYLADVECQDDGKKGLGETKGLGATGDAIKNYSTPVKNRERIARDKRFM